MESNTAVKFKIKLATARIILSTTIMRTDRLLLHDLKLRDETTFPT